MAKEKITEKITEVSGKAKRLKNLKEPWKKGQSGNPQGRRKGQRDYKTLYWLGLQKIAEKKGMTAEEVEETLHAAAIEKAAKDVFFFKEINERVFGKITEKVDVTSGGKTLADVIAAASHARKRKASK